MAESAADSESHEAQPSMLDAECEAVAAMEGQPERFVDPADLRRHCARSAAAGRRSPPAFDALLSG